MQTYNPITQEIVDKLKAITGPSYVKTDKDILVQYQTDYENDPQKFHMPDTDLKFFHPSALQTICRKRDQLCICPCSSISNQFCTKLRAFTQFSLLTSMI